jgi:hypothetical protein
MPTIMLSEAGMALLMLHVEQGEVPVNDSNRELHREPASAGLLVPVHTFSGGREQFYRFTREGWDFACALKVRDRMQGCDEISRPVSGVMNPNAPSPLESASRPR